MPADTQYNSWTAAGYEGVRSFKTPSGNKCLIRNLEMEDVLELGLLDRIDVLTSIVQEEHIDRVAGTSKKAKGRKSGKPEPEPAADDNKAFLATMKDPAKRREIIEVMSLVAQACVVEPKLHDIPWVDDPNAVTAENPSGHRKLEQNEREPALAYIDYIDFMDKISIFHEVFGGMENLQQFRKEADESLGDVADEPKSQVSAIAASKDQK